MDEEANSILENKRKNQRALSSYLENFSVSFNYDLDSLWAKVDKNNNGVLEKEECRIFM